MSRLGIVITSTRPGRVGPAVGAWFFERAGKQGAFEPVLVDLAEVNLPLFDEAAHPRLGKYEHEHTKKWSALVSSLDAFVFVLPEYNYAMPATLLNALDYLAKEWAYKACAFVSYGGISAGTRSAHMVRQIVPVLKMMPIPEAVNIPLIGEKVQGGVLAANEVMDRSADTLLGDLAKWDKALATLRA